MKVHLVPSRYFRSQETYAAWVSREDLCACGLRKGRGDASCEASVHRKRTLTREEVRCLLAKGFGHVGDRFAVAEDGRLVFARGKVLAALAGLGLLTHQMLAVDRNQKEAAAQRGKDRELREINRNYIRNPHLNPYNWPHHDEDVWRAMLPLQRGPEDFTPVDHLLYHDGTPMNMGPVTETGPWGHMRRYSRALTGQQAYFEVPYDEASLPKDMRSVPLEYVLERAPSAERVEWTRLKCNGFILWDLNLCVITDNDEDALTVGKVGLVFRIMSAKKDIWKRSSTSPLITVMVVKDSDLGSDLALAKLAHNSIKLGTAWLFSPEATGGALIHEVAHLLEGLLPEIYKRRLHDLYLKYLPKIKSLNGLWAPDEARCIASPDAVLNYASLELEFFTTAVESWFNNVDSLLFGEGHVGLYTHRVTRNRQDLIRVFPELAVLMSELFLPYSLNNRELDAGARKWATTGEDKMRRAQERQKFRESEGQRDREWDWETLGVEGKMHPAQHLSRPTTGMTDQVRSSNQTSRKNSIMADAAKVWLKRDRFKEEIDRSKRESKGRCRRSPSPAR